MTPRLRESLPGLAALAAFLLALFLLAWLPRVVTLAFFPLRAGDAVPDAFFLMHESAGTYDVVSWKTYATEREKAGIRTFRLAEAGGEIRPKATFTFRVLRDDGSRQLVEVEFDGPYQSWSRYEAYADRAVPLAYYSSASDDDGRALALAKLAAALIACLLAAWGAQAAVKRVLA